MDKRKKYEVDGDMLIFSVRYALGRKSYAPLVILDNVEHNISVLDDGELYVLQREIKEAGLDLDGMVVWEKVLEIVESEMDFREIKR